MPAPGIINARVAILALVATVLVYVLVIHDAHVPPKVKAAHFLLRMLTLGVPRWVVTRLILRKSPGHWDGVHSIDHVLDLPGHSTRKVIYREYVPDRLVSPNDLVLWVHGGGFVLGAVDEFQIDGTCRTMAHECGMRVMSVEYRKTPEHDIKAGFDDVLAMLEHVAREWPNARIALAGESAGATLALGTALKRPDLVHHLLLAYPGLLHGIGDLEGWILSSAVLDWFMSHHRLPEDAVDRAEVEAFFELLSDNSSHAEELSRLPPVNIVSAGLDPLLVGAHKLEAKLRRNGVVVEHDHFEMSVHGFFSLQVAESERAIAQACSKLFRLRAPPQQERLPQ